MIDVVNSASISEVQEVPTTESNRKTVNFEYNALDTEEEEGGGLFEDWTKEEFKQLHLRAIAQDRMDTDRQK